MKKRILFAILGLLIVIAVLAGVKVLQIRTMVEHGKKAVLPPDTVTTVTARSESWETSLSAVGSLTAVQGVTVAAELPAKVVEIAFEPGAKVKRGDLLIRQDTSVEEAQLPGAEAQVTLTESVLARDVEMLKEKIISQADYDAAVAAHRQAMAQVETLRATIAKKTVRAPFGGRLGVRQVNLGQTLREGDPIVTLQSLDPIYVNFALPQQELSRLRVGLPVRVTSDALPGTGDRRPHHDREPAGGRRNPQRPVAGDGGEPGGNAPPRDVRQHGGRPPGPEEGDRPFRPRPCSTPPSATRSSSSRTTRRERAARRSASSSCGSARGAATSSPSRTG